MVQGMKSSWDYEIIKRQLVNIDLPAMVVNMDILDQNIANIRLVAEQSNKNIRIATKSIRVPELIRYIIEKGGEKFAGLMCYSVKEAGYLTSLGFSNIFVAYPTSSASDIELFYRLSQSNHNISLAVDNADQINLIEKTWKANGLNTSSQKAKLCIDVDMSWKPLGTHLGVFRSPIISISRFTAVLAYILQSDIVQLSGIMGYEAQIAGMGDQNPFAPILNPAKKLIKSFSVRDVFHKRERIHRILSEKGVEPEFFNGGGTGSVNSTKEEPWITEIAVGSGFLQGHLFDYYALNRNKPAICFALQVSRKPQQNIVTCKSGGFIASGQISKDKMPLPFLPKGLKITGNEGFGEVQTPVLIPPGLELTIGDPLLFRPAKSGEIAEHFTGYLLMREHQIYKWVKTYRGDGQCFY
jgi:D-serine deaminase-like pyridoxal phosphate-dependent protein